MCGKEVTKVCRATTSYCSVQCFNKTRVKTSIATTNQGYIRRKVNGVVKMEHRRVWELNYGPIPKGYQVHHINGIKTDNSLPNLELLTPLEHKRKHSNLHVDSRGKTLKLCPKCNTYKDIELDYYWYPYSGVYPKCKSCCVLSSVALKKGKKVTTDISKGEINGKP
jgi:hypothetical protein